MYLFLLFAVPLFYYIFSNLRNQKKDDSVVALEVSTFSKGFLIFLRPELRTMLPGMKFLIFMWEYPGSLNRDDSAFDNTCF